MVARDGGIFCFGDAPFLGSATGKASGPVMGMAARPVPSTDAVARTGGYWIVAHDGGVFSFGAARFAGAGVGTDAAGRAVAIAADVDGDGYWIASNEGAVVALHATDHGSPLEDAR
jgi:hypothetical protein